MYAFPARRFPIFRQGRFLNKKASPSRLPANVGGRRISKLAKVMQALVLMKSGATTALGYINGPV
jgi:hypothetical protein